MNSISEHLPFEVDLDLIRRLDRNGPRYTSYPTADRLHEAFGPDTYKLWAAKRNIGGVQRALSIYVHLPFCNTICYYCGCNKVVTSNKSRGVEYLKYLDKEIALQAPLFSEDPRVEQMHWGGGTPTFFNTEQMRNLYVLLQRNFEFSPEGEYSIEIDPRTVDEKTVAELRAMGFNRLSLGVQDFDPDVQQAVNRIQSEKQTLAIINTARREGFLSVNVDLIYGLPKQNLITFNRTLAQIVAARPDRIAVYNYAHLPARFKTQRQIIEADLPSPETKLKLLALSAQRLTEAGYVYIGMDHFALPEDSLAVAQRQGRLHRNFQGYSTHAECDLVALGVSAIGSIGPTYSQNYRRIEDYYDSLDHDELPIMRGLELTADDLLRRAVIQSLMCHFTLSKQAIELSYLIDFDKYFVEELAELAGLAKEGLLDLDDQWINVTPVGRMLIRNICMVFDKYLRHESEVGRYSRVI
jgi:oxygen-independent coproporphyrinogen-3 oxidase